MDAPELTLEPLPYHLELRDYLKSRERELWDWFASARAKADCTEKLRMDLLKNTYRLAPETHADLYQSVETVKARLNLDIPVTVYQAQHCIQNNAALFFIPGQGHVVFFGSVLSLFNAEEIKSVLGHELAHYQLWHRDDGEFHVVDNLMHSLANDPRATTSHEQTARKLQLYTEVFADRGALHVTGDLHTAISSRLKMDTGLGQVSPVDYLRQAEEVFANGNVATEGLSHPESFIRARALALWYGKSENAAAQIRDMIEGVAALDDLDLIAQMRMTAATRKLIEHLLRPKWFQTSAVLGHAKMFFADFQPLNGAVPTSFDDLKFSDAKLREYLCYVLLDFVTTDAELDELPLVAALDLSRQLELDAQFEKLAAKELKLKVRDVRKLKEQAAELLAKAEVAGE